MATELQSALQVTTPSGALDSHMLIILAIMIIAGLLGGAANYFLSEKQIDQGRHDWLKHPILGVVAALTVPLFLNMMSSTLLEGARTKPLDLYVFAGFCLIYVVASRKLVENVALKLLSQLDHVKRDMQQIKQQRREQTQVIIKEDKPEAPPEPKVEPRESLSYNDIEILRTLAEESYVYGNLAALCDKTGLARDLVSQRLTVMKAMGVIETRINDKNVLHWFVSPRGKQVLSEILTGEDKKIA